MFQMVNRKSKCKICGKKVMGLANHMKKHGERPIAETPFKGTENLESRPGLKPRRAALK